LTAAPFYTVHETEKGWAVEAKLPGVQKSGLNVHVEQNLLTVTGQRNSKTPAQDIKILHREIHDRDYSLKLTLGQDVDQSNIRAELVDGLLKITLPKLPSTQPRQIEVK
jgi:HSP20 family protein